MSIDSLIAATRTAVADDPANAQALFSAEGTLVGITEVDIRTGAHTFKVDEPPALGGEDVAANPVQYALASLGSWKATSTSAASSASTTPCGRDSPRSASR